MTPTELHRISISLPIPTHSPRIHPLVTEVAPPTFLDVPNLLESSVPRPRAGWLGYGAGGLLLVVLMATLLVAGSEEGRNLARFLSAIAMVAVVIAMAAVATVTVRRFRSQQ